MELSILFCFSYLTGGERMAVPYDILAADDWISIVKPSRKAKICINGDVKKCAFRGGSDLPSPVIYLF